MRHLRLGVTILLLGLGACAASPLPPGADNSPPPDLLDGGTGGVDFGPVDMAHTHHRPDLSPPQDGSTITPGDALMSNCSTACDCPSGQACLQNSCMAIPDFNIYCCSSTTQCPQGQACEDPQGDVGLCGGPTLPIPISQLCGFIPCQDSSICDLVGCGSCQQGNCSAAGTSNPPPPR